MFTYFTDRDGKFQLKSLAESAFDPLSRTCRFMLREEAHHMFVGDTGISRVAKRTVEVMKALGTDDPAAIRRAGAIDLPTLQRYLNFWFSSSLDLFGAENSSNAATYFANAIKGRPDEESFADHLCTEGSFAIDTPGGSEEIPLRNAMNEATRAAYIKDCAMGLARWNRALANDGVGFAFTLPSARFRRGIGAWAGRFVDPSGRVLSESEWRAREGEFLPSDGDKAFINSLMHGVTEPGKIASWIAPPIRGIDGLPFEYEYVLFH